MSAFDHALVSEFGERPAPQFGGEAPVGGDSGDPLAGDCSVFRVGPVVGLALAFDDQMHGWACVRRA